jgi:adenosylcobinamide amidohydrolase
MRSNDHGSSDDTRSRSTDRVHEDSAQSAQQAGTVNAAEVVTVQHLVKRCGNVLVVNDVSFSKRVEIGDPSPWPSTRSCSVS